MRLPNVSGEFRVGGDPELRFTPTGKAVCNLSLIATESVKQPDGSWEDGDSTPWITATLWQQQAEEAAENITKGALVVVTGQLFVREYEARDGGKGQSIELKWCTVGLVSKPKTQRSTGSTGRQSYGDDPWATPASTPGGRSTPNVPADPWGARTTQDEEPPF